MKSGVRGGEVGAAGAAASGLHEFLARMPKVEIHVHLEGSIPPPSLLALARKHRLDLPDSLAGLEEWFRFRDFEHFVQIYVTICRCLKSPEDFQQLIDAVAAEQARQNVVYTEVHFTVGTHLMLGHSSSELRDAIAEALVDVERRHGVRLRFITDVVRNVPFKWADLTLEWALEMQGRGVVALGLSGFEATHPNEPFVDHFRAAAAAGLRRVAHAGEHAGPASIRSVRELCGAERLGHGVRAVEDPELLAELVAEATPFEVCPTSNVRLGVVPDLASHPFEKLRAAGANVTVNSDDPPLFATTLSEEYQRLADTFGYDAETCAALSLAALRASFLSADEKAEREQEFRGQFSALGEELLGRAVVPEQAEPSERRELSAPASRGA